MWPANMLNVTIVGRFCTYFNINQLKETITLWKCTLSELLTGDMRVRYPNQMFFCVSAECLWWYPSKYFVGSVEWVWSSTDTCNGFRCLLLPKKELRLNKVELVFIVSWTLPGLPLVAEALCFVWIGDQGVVLERRVFVLRPFLHMMKFDWSLQLATSIHSELEWVADESEVAEMRVNCPKPEAMVVNVLFMRQMVSWTVNWELLSCRMKHTIVKWL